MNPAHHPYSTPPQQIKVAAGPEDNPNQGKIEVVLPEEWAANAREGITQDIESMTALERATVSGRVVEMNAPLTDKQLAAMRGMDCNNQECTRNPPITEEEYAELANKAYRDKVYFAVDDEQVIPYMSKEEHWKIIEAQSKAYIRDHAVKVNQPKSNPDACPIEDGDPRVTVEEAQETTIKDSNPKDSIGVRKVGYSCLPTPVLAECGVAMLEGAHKYGRHNYRVVGVKASVYYDAVVCRHMGGWWEGENIDDDSGMNHITKAITSLMVLRDAMIRGKMIDDRPPSTLGYIAALNEKASDVINKYPNPKAAYTIDCQTGDIYQP